MERTTPLAGFSSFVISGFIMMAVSFPGGVAKETPSRFLLKRVARIYPLYWGFAAVMLAIWSAGFLQSIVSSPGDVLLNLALLPHRTPLLYVSWTLVHEINFYILFALLLFFRNPLFSLIGITLLLAVQTTFASMSSEPAILRFLASPIVYEFCMGMALGYFYCRGWLRRVPAWGVAAAVLAICVAPYFIQDYDTTGLPRPQRVAAWGAPSVVLVAAGVFWRYSADLWSRFWVLLGDASYALYLAHPLVMMAYALALEKLATLSAMPQWAPILVVTGLSIAGAIVTHLLIERPLIVVARRLLGLARPPVASPGAPTVSTV